MALPVYATPAQRLWHYIYLVICTLVLFFLVMPLVAVIPISFSVSPFLQFTPEMLRLDPDAFSLRWYRIMIGDCSDPGITTVCSDNWKIGAKNSLFIGVIATLLATTLGIFAALGLSRPIMPFRKLIMAVMISPTHSGAVHMWPTAVVPLQTAQADHAKEDCEGKGQGGAEEE